MEYWFLLQLEVLLLLISSLYLVYYFGEKIFKNNSFFSNTFASRRPKRENNLESQEFQAQSVASKKQKKVNKKPASQKHTLNQKDKSRLTEILKRVKMNASKWYFDTAKNLVIEWLAIENTHKELNLELASIYEREKNYKNAQYIYEDLLEKHPENYEIIKSIASCLGLQAKFKKSIQYYTQAFEKKKSDMEVLDALCNLCLESQQYEQCIVYLKLYLNQKPRNSDKLSMKWFCLEQLGQKKQAIEVYTKVLELQPYNSEVIKRVKQLEQNTL